MASDEQSIPLDATRLRILMDVCSTSEPEHALNRILRDLRHGAEGKQDGDEWYRPMSITGVPACIREYFVGDAEGAPIISFDQIAHVPCPVCGTGRDMFLRCIISGGKAVPAGFVIYCCGGIQEVSLPP